MRPRSWDRAWDALEYGTQPLTAVPDALKELDVALGATVSKLSPTLSSDDLETLNHARSMLHILHRASMAAGRTAYRIHWDKAPARITRRRRGQPGDNLQREKRNFGAVIAAKDLIADGVGKSEAIREIAETQNIDEHELWSAFHAYDEASSSLVIGDVALVKPRRHR